MRRILILQPILERLVGAPPDGAAFIQGWPDQDAVIAAHGAEIEAILASGLDPMDGAFMDRFPKLGLIACIAAGYDSVDVDAARSRGIEVTHSPGLNAADVADMAVGLLLALMLGLPASHRHVTEDKWRERRMPMRPTLRERKIGIVGLGAIGSAVAGRLPPFGMTAAWWGPRAKPDSLLPRADALIELARDSDALVVCCKADDSNRGLIDADVIDALGPAGFLVNVARGSIVDEPALLSALKDGRLAGAGLDVFAEEPTDGALWRDLPNVVLAPHMGGACSEVIRLQADLTRLNLSLFLSGQPVATPVP